MDGRELTCVAFYPGLDTLSESDAVETGGSLKVDEYAASLPDSLSTEIRICASDKEEGDELDYEVEFEADPEPDKVSVWGGGKGTVAIVMLICPPGHVEIPGTQG